MKAWGPFSGYSLASGAALALAATLWAVPQALAQDAVKVVSHRYPALEFYAKAMESAVPGVRVEPNLMPFDKYQELATITLSQGSDAYDIIYVTPVTLLLFAKNGWLEPIDDLFEKYKAEYKLDDIPQSLLDRYRYNGKLYSIPYTANTMVFFYRADLFKAAGIEPPKTFADYVAAAEKLKSASIAGTVMSLKPVDAALNEVHWYFNANGVQWFDDKWKPTFNSDAGVKAIDLLKRVSKVAPSGFTAAANDESTVNLQQGLAAMGIQWSSRAPAMDDPTKSKVVGLMDWMAPPGGGQPISLDGYAISKFTKKNKETLFKVIAATGSEDNERKAVQLSVPTRRAVMNDADVLKRFRFYSAVQSSVAAAKSLPPLPEMSQVGEIVTRHVIQAVTGGGDTKAALDAAAKEVESLLEKRGYYKT